MEKHEPANDSDNEEQGFAPDTSPVWWVPMKRCLKRMHGWRIPPNWSARDWFNEMGSVARLAAVEAAAAFDASRGTPFEVFISSRILSRGLTFYRKEWTYATHHLETDSMQAERVLGNDYSCVSKASDIPAGETVREVLASLPESGRWLIEELYLRERTQASIGRQLGISQRAVSKRKEAVLCRLRRLLGHLGTTPNRSHEPVSVTHFRWNSNSFCPFNLKAV